MWLLCSIGAGLDGAGKTTALSHIKRPYQFYSSEYTNRLLAPPQKAGANSASSSDAAKDGSSKSKAEGKTDGETKTDGSVEAKTSGETKTDQPKKAIVPTPELVPFDEVILPTNVVQLSEFVHNNQHVRAWDFSGQGRYRGLWEEYFLQVCIALC